MAPRSKSIVSTNILSFQNLKRTAAGVSANVIKDLVKLYLLDGKGIFHIVIKISFKSLMPIHIERRRKQNQKFSLMFVIYSLTSDFGVNRSINGDHFHL